MAEKMAPTKLGYGVKQGTEAAAHAARRFLEDMGPGQALLKLDFVNAFNAISRDVILRTVYDELPELFQFISTCYDSASHLCFSEFLISSDEGAQQGDPLGPLIFCASSLKLAKSLKSELNIWYMEDGTLGGDVDVLLDDLKTVWKVGSNLGLTLNETKCELITEDPDVISKFRIFAPSIMHVRSHQATLLGAPIGDDDKGNKIISVKIEVFQRLANRLKQLSGSAHDAFFLQKNCFSFLLSKSITTEVRQFHSRRTVGHTEYWIVWNGLKSSYFAGQERRNWNQVSYRYCPSCLLVIDSQFSPAHFDVATTSFPEFIWLQRSSFLGCC